MIDKRGIRYEKIIKLTNYFLYCNWIIIHDFTLCTYFVLVKEETDMVVLFIIQLLLLALQVSSVLLLIKTGNDLWLFISNIFFAGVVGMMVYILMSYGLS